MRHVGSDGEGDRPSWIRGDWSEWRGSLWVMPTVAVILALATGAVLSYVRVPDGALIGRVIFRGDAADARQLLTAVTQTMITVTSLVFVLTVVALQIASSQFSPRLLRSFLRDRGTQLVLSTFVGTVAYSLAGLHTVGSRPDGGEEFLPRVAVTGALLLALVSVGMLVYYIQHITNSIRIDTIMHQVERDTLEVVRRQMPRRTDAPAAGAGAGQSPGASHADLPLLLDVPPDAVAIPALRSGYVQRLRAQGLLQLAVDNGVHVQLVQAVGLHVVPRRPLAWVWGDRVDPEAWTHAVDRAVVVHHERRAENDVGFGLRQLVDIAARTLSPSLNDPYSGVQAVHHLTVVLCEMAGRSTPPVALRDPSGDVRVAAPTVDFPSYLQTGCSHIRWSMHHRPRVVLALLRLLGDVGAVAIGDDRRAAVGEQIDLVVADAERVIPNPVDLARITEAAAAARATLW